MPRTGLAQEPVTTAVETAPAAPATSPAEAEALKRKAEREAELAALTRDLEVSASRQREIEQEIAAIDRDTADINAAVLRTAGRIKGLEADLANTERRLQRLAENEDAVRASLWERRGTLAEVLASLQRIGRRPPPALAVRPADALAAVRSAILLNAIMPDLRIEAEALASDLEELTRLKISITAEKDRLAGDSMRLVEEQSRLELLISAKRQQRVTSADTLSEERRRSEELAGKAGSLKELIARLEAEIASARKAAEEAEQATEQRNANGRRPGDPFADPGRLAPAIAFAEAKGQLPRPVAGTMLKDFGQADDFGGVTEGQSISTRAGARVTAPNDGWVVYSGPFRSFGQLLILNAGDGYHVLLAGMDRIDVELGQFVLAGEPVGVMGSTHWASASTIGLGSTGPVLYVEFRKDGSAIDPTPWWARTEEEKVRG
ncbi:peptidoglycan DD-metalloendopeptidase family protein [Microvirga tunisiensis]|uniref:Peptidoglycan DD-metalloendopeptidase family protein n=1 Tax=Pannonibacter tanglangensis TaxID=2750084 RepID=A0A7X5F432_9HYPH|nr:peptidoglycan DD-metalloendopeptidase family protein [Pannonibacter sp. XCT-53]NBN79417.1 peptidoglycan DD-metalloendopeptidase family protein [Pannonibacter sp. XCT-53]